jgi:hypothetical protein
MRFLPVQPKPEIAIDYSRAVVEIQNAISVTVANELIAHILQPSSGVHRRGSKTPERCEASFSTCLLFNTELAIYDLLDPLWGDYIISSQANVSFIEPYELKAYSEGDGFGYHTDSYSSIYHALDRKLNVILQLSADEAYEGGDLFVGDYRCSRQQCTAIFFPSHYVHNVTTISQGIRYSLIGHAWGPYGR